MFLGLFVLVDTLHRLGLSCSFDEVLSYQTNAALAQSSGMSGPIEGPFAQYIADSADHNAATLVGHGTFHGMRIMVALSPSFSFSYTVPRRNVISKDLQSAARININPWT